MDRNGVDLLRHLLLARATTVPAHATETSLRAPVVGIVERPLIQRYLSAHILKLLLRLLLLLESVRGFLLEVDKLLGERILLRCHLLFELANLVSEVLLKSFTDVLNDTRLVDLRLWR